MLLPQQNGFLEKKTTLFFCEISVCLCELAVHSVLTLQDLIKHIYFGWYYCKSRHLLVALWSCCQQSLLAHPFIVWSHTMDDLKHWLCKKKEMRIVGLGYAKGTILEKGVEEAIFPRWPAESLGRNNSLGVWNHCELGLANASKIWHGLCFLEGRRMPLKSRTSNEGRVGRLKEDEYGQSG